jgi:acyl dehydratase
MLTNYVGDGRLTAFGVRFTSQVFPGATLTATATIEAIREDNGSHIIDLSVSTKDGEGVEVIKGQASARVNA